MMHRYMKDVYWDLRSLRRSVEIAGTLADVAKRSTTMPGDMFELSWHNVGTAVRLAETDYDRLQHSLRQLAGLE